MQLLTKVGVLREQKLGVLDTLLEESAYKRLSLLRKIQRHIAGSAHTAAIIVSVHVGYAIRGADRGEVALSEWSEIRTRSARRARCSETLPYKLPWANATIRAAISGSIRTSSAKLAPTTALGIP